MEAAIFFDDELDQKLLVLANAINGLKDMPSETVKESWAVPMLSDLIKDASVLLNKHNKEELDRRQCRLFIERGNGRLLRTTRLLNASDISFYVTDDKMELDEKVPYTVIAYLNQDEIRQLDSNPDIARIEI